MSISLLSVVHCKLYVLVASVMKFKMTMCLTRLEEVKITTYFTRLEETKVIMYLKWLEEIKINMYVSDTFGRDQKKRSIGVSMLFLLSLLLFFFKIRPQSF